MLLLGILGGRIGSVPSLMSGCSTLLRAAMLAFCCPHVIVSMNRRKVEHTMNKFERWKELVSLL